MRDLYTSSAALCAVALLHGVALYGLLSNKIMPQAAVDIPPIFVSLLPAPVQPQPEVTPPPVEPPPPPKPKPVVRKPPPKRLIPVKPALAPEPVFVPEVVELPAEPEPILDTRSPAPEISEQVVSAPPPPPPPPVQAPSFSAAYLHNPPPAYPLVSKRLGESGRILLHVHVSADGRAAEVKIQDSSGSQRLDRAALEAVQGWRFVPAKQGDRALAAWVVVPIVFQLEQ